jgi:hypothetical protein
MTEGQNDIEAGAAGDGPVVDEDEEADLDAPKSPSVKRAQRVVSTGLPNAVKQQEGGIANDFKARRLSLIDILHRRTSMLFRMNSHSDKPAPPKRKPSILGDIWERSSNILSVFRTKRREEKFAVEKSPAEEGDELPHPFHRQDDNEIILSTPQQAAVINNIQPSFSPGAVGMQSPAGFEYDVRIDMPRKTSVEDILSQPIDSMKSSIVLLPPLGSVGSKPKRKSFSPSVQSSNDSLGSEASKQKQKPSRSPSRSPDGGSESNSLALRATGSQISLKSSPKEIVSPRSLSPVRALLVGNNLAKIHIDSAPVSPRSGSPLEGSTQNPASGQRPARASFIVEDLASGDQDDEDDDDVSNFVDLSQLSKLRTLTSPRSLFTQQDSTRSFDVFGQAQADDFVIGAEPLSAVSTGNNAPLPSAQRPTSRILKIMELHSSDSEFEESEAKSERAIDASGVDADDLPADRRLMRLQSMNLEPLIDDDNER